MGVIKRYKENNCEIAVWNLSESLEELTRLAPNIDTNKFKNKKRKKEFLASRLLLKKLDPNQEITYNKYGAPKLAKQKFISISHSQDLVAIIISNEKVGIDIELIREKGLKLASKFILKENYLSLTKEKANLIWCCKETIFKWHQKGNIDFKNDITLMDFPIEDKGIIIAKFQQIKLTLHYRKIGLYFLVYVCK